MRAWQLLMAVLLVAWCAGVRAEEPKLKPGDVATVKTDNAPIRQGQEVLARLRKGQPIKVLHVQGGFALVFYRVKGEKKDGYMSVADLEPPPKEESKAVAPLYVPDDLIVTARETKLMLGKDILGAIAKGTRLKVEKVKGDWLGVHADVAGKSTWGWLQAKDVTYAPFDEEEKGGKKPAGKDGEAKDDGGKQEEPKGEEK